jgi:hypothetical protein
MRSADGLGWLAVCYRKHDVDVDVDNQFIDVSAYWTLTAPVPESSGMQPVSELQLVLHCVTCLDK